MIVFGGVTKIKDGAELIDDLGDAVVSKLDDVAEESLEEISESISELGGKSFNKALKEVEIDNFVVESYSSTVADAAKKKGRKLSWEEVQPFLKRGNDFNAKGRAKYTDDFVEVVLKGVNGKKGKRLDTYIPPANGNPGKIISRKATTLSKIQPDTFKSYLNELITKYPNGAELNSSKFPAGTKLDGDYKLEIPESNRAFFESSAEFKKVLSDFNTNKIVNIEIIYLVE